MFNLERVRKLNSFDLKEGNVVYWMSRDQRIDDNWALIYAQRKAIEFKKPLIIVFCLVPQFLNAGLRQYGFMLRSLLEIQKESIREYNIPFIFLIGDPKKEIPNFIEENEISLLITDFDPLKIKRKWKENIIKEIKIPFLEVDTHNIVPCWIASDKKEYSAFTFRKKIKKLLPKFLTEIPKVERHPFSFDKAIKFFSFEELISFLRIDFSVSEVSWIKPGEKEALKTLEYFIKYKLEEYPLKRNDLRVDFQSNLSPYLHFGQISSQRVALEILKSEVSEKAKEVFLEQLIVRKELSDNFCFYEPNYDSLEGAPSWAKETLRKHAKDKREYIYTLFEFENAKTHDKLWNYAQREMVEKGKMHGYLRMYWAKKILEWTRSPEEAIHIAIYLNDKYELDGRDPNGYTGIAWSICGVHDRPFKERPILGKIRYMSEKSLRLKFNIEKNLGGKYE